MLSSDGWSDSDKFDKKLSHLTLETVKESAAPAKVSVFLAQEPPIPPDTGGLQAYAELYELSAGVFTAVTNRMLPVTDTDFLVHIVFTFESIGQIKLSKDDIKFCTTNKELDATVIELTEQCVKSLRQQEAKFNRLIIACEGGEKAIAQNSDCDFSFDTGAFIRRRTTNLLVIAIFHLATSR